MYDTKLKVTGIPYAEPPVGNLRLEPPILKTQLNVSTVDASDFGPGCLQPVSRFTNSSYGSLQPVSRFVVPSHLLQVLMGVGSCAVVFRGLFDHQHL